MSLTTDVGRSTGHHAAPARAGRGRRALRAAVVPVFGILSLVTLAAGLGLVLPRLAKEGAGPAASLGVVAVVTGGAAALWCLWRLLRGTKRRWWLLTLPAALVAAYLTMWAVGIGVAASFPAHPELGTRSPSDVGLRDVTVTVRTGDGVDLAAWWVPSENGAAVVLLHGAGSTRSAVLDQAAVLASHGYGVLLLDARGHGGSKGQGMDFGWYGERDAAAAVDFLAGQPGVASDRIGIVGLSMGGEEAIGAAGADARVRAVVAEGATNRVAGDKGYLSEYGVRGDIQRGIDWATYAVAGLLTEAPEPQPLRDAAAAAQADGTPTPMLLVTAGELDDERLAAEYIERAAPDAVEVWTVPGAAHTRGLRTDPDGWEARVIGFLDSALGGTAAG